MTLPAEMLERARAIPIESVVADRGVKLRRVGRELVGPCPRCGGYDRFRVTPSRGMFLCRGCSAAGDGIALAMHLHGIDFRAAVEMLTGAEHSTSARRPAQDRRTTGRDAGDEYARDQARKAAWLWDRRQPLAGSIAERYLREARGYGGPLPATLGFLPARGEHGPAMIAAFALTPEIEPGVLGEPVDVAAAHLTKLTPDGRAKADVKPNKVIIGSPASRPIVLAPVNDMLGLAVTEGIEDGLSVAWAVGLGVWAAGAAGFMPALADTVPNYVECVTIFAHADPAGQRGARALADRLVARGIEVFVEGAS
jgi:hypothetical protein